MSQASNRCLLTFFRRDIETLNFVIYGLQKAGGFAVFIFRILTRESIDLGDEENQWVSSSYGFGLLGACRAFSWLQMAVPFVGWNLGLLTEAGCTSCRMYEPLVYSNTRRISQTAASMHHVLARKRRSVKFLALFTFSFWKLHVHKFTGFSLGRRSGRSRWWRWSWMPCQQDLVTSS